MGCSGGCARWRRPGRRWSGRRLVSEADLANIWVTNPTRRLFGRAGPTKLDVAVYYAAVGDFMLPHLFGRPVSLVRCPTGKPADCFFQRHRFQGMPAGVESFETQTSDEEDRTYLTVARRQGVPGAGAVRGGGVPHLGVRGERLERADRIVFDLDPGEGVAWREVVEAAVHVRGELDGAGARRLRQDDGRQGGARGGAGDAEARLEGGACGGGRAGGGDRGEGAGDLHHGDGSVEPEAADLHRLPPQRAQRHRGGAIFVAGAQQSAGICAA